jgi:uncharacterized protein YceK
MKKVSKILLFVLVLSGCASVMRDDTQIVPIQSNVDNVNIEVTNSQGDVVYRGQTPTTLDLRTSRSGYFNPEKYFIKASKNGYVTQYTPIDYHISNWYWFGNAVFGGLIGWFIVDPMTGKMYYLDDVATVNMTPLQK